MSESSIGILKVYVSLILNTDCTKGELNYATPLAKGLRVSSQAPGITQGILVLGITSSPHFFYLLYLSSELKYNLKNICAS